MLGMLAGFGVTLSRAMREGAATPVRAAPRLRPPPVDGGERAHRSAAEISAAKVAPWLTPFWLAGVIAFQLHSLVSWVAARRMLRRGVCSVPDVWEARFVRLRERLRISTTVALLESCLADVPVVIGYLRPVVLVPVGMLAGMPAAQIDAILLHELAHVRRRDYLVNALQTVVEGFLFYHPAVWWISGVIRAERENCCDDLVVATSGDAREYAAALAALEQTRWAAHDAALAVTGGNLMKRIRRLLNPLDAPRTAISPVLSAAILTITAALALTAWQTRRTRRRNEAAYKALAQRGRRHTSSPTRNAKHSGVEHRRRAREVHRAVLAAARSYARTPKRTNSRKNTTGASHTPMIIIASGIPVGRRIAAESTSCTVRPMRSNHIRREAHWKTKP